MRTSTTDALAAHQLAGLAALEAAIVSVARAIVHTYPAVSKVERPREPPDLVTARNFIDQCEYLLAALDAHRRSVAAHLPDEHPDKPACHDIPF